MLLSKTVKLKWHPSNKTHYVEKGYIYTKMGDEFEVKVEDLTKGSKVKVKVKCDYKECSDPYLKPIKWQDYLKCVKTNNVYYCNCCATKLYGAKNSRISKLKKSKSFEQWCYDNLDIDYANEILSRWDYEKNIDKHSNIIKPNEISYGSEGFNKKGFWFKCLKHEEHRSEQKRIIDFVILKGEILDCNQCNSFGQYLINNFGENAIKIYWSDKNIVNPFEVSYGSNRKIWIKCQEKPYHEDYKIYPSNFLKGNRCSYCGNFKVHPLDSFGQYIIDNYGEEFLNKVWSKKNKKSAFEYTPNSNKEVWWKCQNDKHEDFKRGICESNIYKFRCPECVRERRESLLQESIRLYLNEIGYTLKHENNCSIVPRNPKTNQPLPFDNEVVDLKLIIEVHGQQHYDITGFHTMIAKRNNTTPEYELHYQKVKDRYKRMYSISKGYEYLEIPYWADDENETWRKLIDDKIRQILENYIKNKQII